MLILKTRYIPVAHFAPGLRGHTSRGCRETPQYDWLVPWALWALFSISRRLMFIPGGFNDGENYTSRQAIVQALC